MSDVKVMKILYEKVNDLVNHYSWDKYSELCDIVYAWNDAHPDLSGIFMCDISMDEDGNETEFVNGIMIEDDYFIFKDKE